MRKTLNVGLLVLLSVLMASTSFAQAVQYHGKLRIGFGDQDNATGFRSNNAIPICAGQGPLINPGTIGTTIGTLYVNAAGTAAPGVGGAMTFNAVTGSGGGAQEKDNGTCNVAIPGFANPRLRSRTQVGAAHWPSRKGKYTTMILTATTPATPTATYMLSANGGNNQAGTFTTWTTMATASAATQTFMGTAISASVPFFGAGNATVRVQPAGRFGGGVPFSGGGGVQLGINFAVATPSGAPLVPGDYGIVSYANGFLPTDPQVFGTDAKGVGILNQATTTVYGATASLFPYTLAQINGRQDLTYAARTPGGTTRLQNGAILTAFGGNTVTTAKTSMQPLIPVISTVAFTGLFGEFTTGQVTYTDKIGDFFTIRKATGQDVATATPAGATRRLQVVAPWGAVIRPVGGFGLPVPTLGFGGIAELDVKVIPAPEPGTLAMLGFGVAGLLGLGAARRRNG